MDKLIYFYSTPEKMFNKAFNFEELPNECLQIIRQLQEKYTKDIKDNDFEDIVDILCQLKVESVRFQSELTMHTISKPTKEKFNIRFDRLTAKLTEIIIKYNKNAEEITNLFIDFIYMNSIIQMLNYTQILN